MSNRLVLSIFWEGPVSSQYRLITGSTPTTGTTAVEETPTTQFLYNSEVGPDAFDTDTVAPTLVVQSLDDIVNPAPGMGAVNVRDDTVHVYNGTADEWRKSIVAGTTGEIDASDIADGSISQAKLATELVAIELVTAFPGSPAAGDTVFLISADGGWPTKGINKLYTWDPAAGDWVLTVDGTDIVANSITAGQIQAGAIGADELAANSVYVKHLVVANFDNLIVDAGAELFADIADSPVEAITADTGVWSVSSAVARSGVQSFRFDQTAQTGVSRLGLTGQQNDITTLLPVQEGEEYSLQGYLTTDSGTGNDVSVRLSWRDSAGDFISHDSSTPTASTAGFVRHSVAGSVPAGASFMCPMLVVEDDNIAELIYGDDFYLRLKLDGALVVDGTIEGSHLGIITVEVSNYIESSNYASSGGADGWRIDGAGSADFSGDVSVGGDLELGTGGRIRTNAPGTERVQLGGGAGNEERIKWFSGHANEEDPAEIQIIPGSTGISWQLRGPVDVDNLTSLNLIDLLSGNSSHVGIGITAANQDVLIDARGSLGVIIAGGTTSVPVDIAWFRPGQFLMVDGSVTLPAHSFEQDGSMGMYRSGSNQLSFSVNSNERGRFTPQGLSTDYSGNDLPRNWYVNVGTHTLTDPAAWESMATAFDKNVGTAQPISFSAVATVKGIQISSTTSRYMRFRMRYSTDGGVVWTNGNASRANDLRSNGADELTLTSIVGEENVIPTGNVQVELQVRSDNIELTFAEAALKVDMVADF